RRISHQKHRRIIITVLALTASIISIGSSYWRQNKHSTFNEGLWFECTNTECFSKMVTTDWMKSCQALMVLGCILNFVCTILFVLSIYSDDLLDPLQRYTGTMMFFAGTFHFIALTLYLVRNMKEEGALRLQWSYFTGWGAFLFNFVLVVDVAVFSLAPLE
uniref:Uncharacterized protein n=1 Tax=Clytia hemisphaerica TaxID=252671 RepID=A0A7M5XE19_9CNID